MSTSALWKSPIVRVMQAAAMVFLTVLTIAGLLAFRAPEATPPAHPTTTVVHAVPVAVTVGASWHVVR